MVSLKMKRVMGLVFVVVMLISLFVPLMGIAGDYMPDTNGEGLEGLKGVEGLISNIGTSVISIIRYFLMIVLFVTFLMKVGELRRAEDDPRLKTQVRNSLILIAIAIVLLLQAENIFNFIAGIDIDL